MAFIRRDRELLEMFGVLDACVQVLAAILIHLLARQIANVTVLYLLEELVRLHLF